MDDHPAAAPRRRPRRPLPLRSVPVRLAIAVTTLSALAVSVPAALSVAPASAAPRQEGGSVYTSRDLARAQLVAGADGGDAVTYWTVGADHRARLATATVQVPKGRTPRRGWPVVAWAHGTRGIADSCAPSSRPTADDTEQIRRWIGRGYAVVTPDYAGLGTAGTPQYFDPEATALNITDAVHAARDVSAVLSRSWAVVGEGAGAAAAITLTRIAPQVQGSGSNFRGAVGYSLPAEFNTLIANLGPSTTPVPPALAASMLYTVTAIRNSHPELRIDASLTPAGKTWFDRASALCVADLTRQLTDVRLGDLFSAPLSANEGLLSLISDRMPLPIKGFSRDIMLIQSLHDTSVITPLAVKYLNDARLADRRVRSRTYLTLDAAQSDTLADIDARLFIDRLLRS